MPIESVWTRNRRAGPDFDEDEEAPPPWSWPPSRIHCNFDWRGPMVPGPEYFVSDSCWLDRIGDTNLYQGSTTDWPDWVEITMTLDEITGGYDFQAVGSRAYELVAVITVAPGNTPPGDPFDIVLIVFIGLPPLHGASARLQSPWP